MKLRFLSALLLSSTITVANAAELVCSGTIEQVHFHAPDRMLIKLSGMNTSVFFCAPNAQWNVPGAGYTTSPEMCRTMVSMFLAGQLAGKSVTRMYFDGDAVPASCSSWIGWSSANIRYVHWAD